MSDMVFDPTQDYNLNGRDNKVNLRELYDLVNTGRLSELAIDALIGLGYYVMPEPNGVNDRDEFVTAAASGKPVWVRPGTYIYDGAGLDGMSQPTFIGCGKSFTTISLTAGSYFLDSTTAWLRLNVSGIKFSGGAGALRNQWIGVNVNGHKIVNDCWFLDYTSCAVSSNALDEPYWKFNDSQFRAANEVATIGVALAGAGDGTVFEACSFLNNTIDVKLRRPNTVRFIGCDFIPYGVGDGVTPRAGIWFCADNTSRGTAVETCKFGNENITVRDYHILIAKDSNTAALVGSSLPDYTTDSTALLSGFTFTDCDMQGSGTGNPPLIYSTTPDLRGFGIKGLNVVGSSPSYIVQFKTVPFAASRLNQNNYIDPILSVDKNATEGVPIAPSNAIGWARPNDLGQMFTDAAQIHPYTGADATGYVKLLPTLINSFTKSNVTATAITDAAGGTDAAEVTSTSVGGFMYAGLTTASITAGTPAWIEFDLQMGAVNPLTEISLRVQYTSNGTIHYRRYIAVDQTAVWKRYRFLWTPREKTTTILVMFYTPSTTTGQIKIGRVRAYHAKEPVPERLTLPDTLTTTAAPAAGAGAALPATPAGYMTVNVNGTSRQIPYY